MGKTLYLMRHGQTMFNVRRKIQGWCDSPLTEKGCDQALHARRYFEDAGITFDHVYCSSAGRACETAELVSDVPYTPTKGLREWGFGLFEGESRLLMPPTPWGDFFADFEGEREADVQRRLAATMTEIMLRDDHSVVLAISHGAACMEFMRAWQPYAAFHYDGIPGNCGIMRFEVRPAGERRCCAEKRGQAKPGQARSAAATGAAGVPVPGVAAACPAADAPRPPAPAPGSTGVFQAPEPPKLIFSLVDVVEPYPEEINQG